MILHFLITVLFIYGIHATTRLNMILRPFHMWIYLKVHGKRRVLLADKMSKVLFDCTPCMASVYGTISFFVYGSFYDPLLQSLVIWVFSLCGFNYILNKILNR